MNHPSASTWIGRLKLRHLQGFLVLADSRTLSDAATRMHMTQSAVSHWLRDLEESAGTPLVLRGRQLRLTPAGDTVRRFAVRVLGDAVRTQDEMDSILEGASARLHVGSITAGVAHFVPHTICAFQAQHTNVAIRMLEGKLDDLLDGLDKRQLDIVVGSVDARIHRPDLTHEVMFNDSIAVIVGLRHPLAARTDVSWSDLMTYDWVMPPRHTLMRNRLEAALLERGGAGIRAKVETASIVTTEILLQHTTYLAVCSGAMAAYLSEKGLVSVLPISTNFGPVGAVWRKEDDYPVLKDFIAILRDRVALSGSCEQLTHL